jgi:hypothetical protein
MRFFKRFRGVCQYKKYLKYKGWNNTWALRALYKSFYLDFQKAENEIDRLRYKNRNNNKSSWKKDPSRLFRLM